MQTAQAIGDRDMEIRPSKTIAEAEAAKDLPDLSTMPLSELVALVLKNDPNFADNQSEEAVFIAACGDEEGGRDAHKKYSVFPKEGSGVRAFCVARLNKITRVLVASASA